MLPSRLMWRWLLVFGGCGLLLQPLSGADSGVSGSGGVSMAGGRGSAGAGGDVGSGGDGVGGAGAGGAGGSAGGAGAGGAGGSAGGAGGSVGAGGMAGAGGTAGAPGGRDAGALDAGRVDAGARDAGAVDAGIVFQESFENAATSSLVPPRFVFDFTASSGSLASIDTTQAANGSQRSLKLDVGPAYADRRVWLLPIPTLQRVFIRFYLLAPSTDTIVGPWVLSAASGRTQRTGYYGSLPFDSQLRMGVENDRFSAGYETTGHYTNPPTGPHTNCWWRAPAAINSGWNCIEYEFDMQRRVMNAWMNGLPVMGMNPLTEMPPTNNCAGNDLSSRWLFPNDVLNLSLGFVTYAGTGPRRSLWFDDVVVATSPIGCR
jgi:hypothetical protein